MVCISWRSPAPLHGTIFRRRPHGAFHEGGRKATRYCSRLLSVKWSELPVFTEFPPNKIAVLAASQDAPPAAPIRCHV